MKAVGGIPAALFFLVYLQNPLTYCNKYDIIKTSKGGEENGAGHRKSLAGAFKSDGKRCYQNHFEETKIRQGFKSQRKQIAFIGRERAGNRPSRKPYYNIICP